MSHDLDINNGIASFVTANEDAWHHLGTTLDHSFTAEEALQEAHLAGWNVRKTPLYTMTEYGSVEIPSQYAVVRDNPIREGVVDPLGVVGSAYSPVQNEEHVDLLNALVDQSGAHFETAGALEGGRKVFVTMKLPSHIRIGGCDPVDTYIAAVNSHDGTKSFTFMVTPVRIVCANTLNMAFQHQRNQFLIRHTRGAQAAVIQKAREALDFTFDYLDHFQEQAEQLINTTMTQSQFEDIINREFGPREGTSPASQTRAQAKVDDMASLFSDASTQEGVRGTAWAGLNALTEWYDHRSPTRGDDRLTARAMNVLLYPEFKERALQLMMQSV